MSEKCEAVTPAETPTECEYCFGNGPVSADHAHELHESDNEKDARIRALETERDGLRAALQEWVWAKDSINGDTNTYFERLNLAEHEARRALEGK